MTQTAMAYFDRVADHWDELRAGYFADAVREAAIAHAWLRPEMCVADVGCGTGFLAAGLAPLVAKVYALDGSAAMLEVARRNLAAFANIVYLTTDGSALPLPEASVDAVLANMYLHHCPDPAAAIREMARLLRPGGRLVITDLDRHEHERLRVEMADEWPGFARTAVKEWLRAAGLVNVFVTDTRQSCCAAQDPGVASPAGISIFVAVGTRRVAGAREAVQTNYAALAGGATPCCAPAPQPESPVTTGSPLTIPLATGCCAAPAAASCCSPANAMPLVVGAPASTAVTWETGYTPEQIAAVPAQAAALALGCGNPTALAALQPGEVVLDIGSGAGIDAFFAARRVGPTGRVIGLDMTPAMIERANRTAAEAGLHNVEFRLGQAEAMPVADASVDVILSNCVINLCEDKGRVFEEAYRVLKEGGRLAISDMVTDEPLPLALRGDAGAWAGCISGALPEREYLDLVRAAGFRDVQAQRSFSGGRIAGVAVYSLSVTARK
ncbi:MAG: arsenite methyltransferase [Anaerolineae bacterium]|nr:arsenite methyltransferase [Anaerolineae bacterium]